MSDTFGVFEDSWNRAIVELRKAIDGAPEGSEQLRKKAFKAEKKREKDKDKKRAKKAKKLAESTCTKGESLYMLAKARLLGRITMDEGTVYGQVIDRSGPDITGPIVKRLRKASADSDLNRDVTSIPYGDPNESTNSRIRNKGAKPAGTIGDLSHSPERVGRPRQMEHKNQRHPEADGVSDDRTRSFVTDEVLGEPDEIEKQMGARRFASARPAAGFAEQSSEVLSSTLAGSEPGSGRRPRPGGGGEVRPIDEGHVQRQSVDRDTQRYEPFSVPGMAPLTKQNGVTGYRWFSVRHARDNFISRGDLYLACPAAVNRGTIDMETATDVVNKCQHGAPIPEQLLRRIVDGVPGEG